MTRVCEFMRKRFRDFTFMQFDFCVYFNGIINAVKGRQMKNTLEVKSSVANFSRY